MQFSLVRMKKWYVHSKQLFRCEENSSVLQKNVQMVPFNITSDLHSWVSCTSCRRQWNSSLTFRNLSWGQDTALISAQIRMILYKQNCPAKTEAELKSRHLIMLRKLLECFSKKSARAFSFLLFLKCWQIYSLTPQICHFR